MKNFYTIRIGTKKDETTGLVGYTNKHKFLLKTTGFNKITNTNWISLGGLLNEINACDTLSDLSIKISMPIETEFNNKIIVDFSAANAVIGIAGILSDFDEITLTELDENVLDSMDVRAVSEEG